MNKKERLDFLVQQKCPHLSRNQVQGFIMQGKVSVDGIVVIKAGTPTMTDALIVVDADVPKYVSRAGFKMEGVLIHFAIDVTDLVIMDAGISTGGFTDCLLQNGAKKVYGIDVGYGQVHEKIAKDSRVEVIERTNLRYVKSVGELVDLVTLDLSFISVLKVMEAVISVLKPTGRLIVLIKPQFEARREQVGRGGIIKDDAIHQEVVARISQGIIDCGFECVGVIESSILGGDGNKEFLGYFFKKV